MCTRTGPQVPQARWARERHEPRDKRPDGCSIIANLMICLSSYMWLFFLYYISWVVIFYYSCCISYYSKSICVVCLNIAMFILRRTLTRVWQHGGFRKGEHPPRPQSACCLLILACARVCGRSVQARDCAATARFRLCEASRRRIWAQVSRNMAKYLLQRPDIIVRRLLL